MNRTKLQQLHARLEAHVTEHDDNGMVTKRDLRDLVACFLDEEKTDWDAYEHQFRRHAKEYFESVEAKSATDANAVTKARMRQREVDAFTAKVYAGAGLTQSPVKPMSAEPKTREGVSGEERVRAAYLTGFADGRRKAFAQGQRSVIEMLSHEERQRIQQELKARRTRSHEMNYKPKKVSP